MLGLMKKDFLLVRKQLLIVVGIMVFYTFILGSGKSFDYQIGLFGGYTVAFMAIIPVTMLGYDEKNKWGKYSSAMPINRKENVISKFLVMLLFLFVDLLAFVIVGFMKGGDIILSGISVFSLAISVSSLILAVSYKFGTDKGRFIFAGIIFVTMAALAYFFTDKAPSLPSVSKSFELVSADAMAYIFLAIALLIYLACMMFSIHVYSKKDL